eukprot:Awhi_evm1s13780
METIDIEIVAAFESYLSSSDPPEAPGVDNFLTSFETFSADVIIKRFMKLDELNLAEHRLRFKKEGYYSKRYILSCENEECRLIARTKLDKGVI